MTTTVACPKILKRGGGGDDVPARRLKMREWKMRYGQKCKGGKYRSRQAAWKAESILYIDRPL